MAFDWREILRRADRHLPGFRQAFLGAVARARRGVPVAQLRARLARGDYAGAIDLVEFRWTGVAPIWERTIGALLRAALSEVGQASYGALGLAGRFDLTNAAAIAWAERQAGLLVRTVSAQQIAVIRAAVAEAVSGQGTVATAATAITHIIGLDPRRAQALTRFRADGALPRAVDRYARRLVRQRAETIARSEVMAAANQGLIESWVQARDAGLLPPVLVKRWTTTRDDRRCPQCAPLEGAVAPLEGVFATARGPVARPPLHAACRCVLTLVRPTGRTAMVLSAAQVSA